MNPVVKYSLARLVLFVVSLAVLAWAGAGPFVAVVGAALVSMLLSYVLLRSMRDQVSRQLSDRMARRLDRVAAVREDESVEDAVQDAIAAERSGAERSGAERSGAERSGAERSAQRQGGPEE